MHLPSGYDQRIHIVELCDASSLECRAKRKAKNHGSGVGENRWTHFYLPARLSMSLVGIADPGFSSCCSVQAVEGQIEAAATIRTVGVRTSSEFNLQRLRSSRGSDEVNIGRRDSAASIRSKTSGPCHGQIVHVVSLKQECIRKCEG